LLQQPLSVVVLRHWSFTR